MYGLAVCGTRLQDATCITGWPRGCQLGPISARHVNTTTSTSVNAVPLGPCSMFVLAIVWRCALGTLTFSTSVHVHVQYKGAMTSRFSALAGLEFLLYAI